VAGRVLGDFPGGGKIEVRPGRYGAYVTNGKVNATLPKGVEADTVTLEQAIELIAAKGGKATPAKKAAAKKPAAKKTTAKKAPAKKGSKAIVDSDEVPFDAD